jgi:hypothetical protein
MFVYPMYNTHTHTHIHTHTQDGVSDERQPSREMSEGDRKAYMGLSAELRAELEKVSVCE